MKLQKSGAEAVWKTVVYINFIQFFCKKLKDYE